jgi:hypothetical protein
MPYGGLTRRLLSVLSGIPLCSVFGWEYLKHVLTSKSFLLPFTAICPTTISWQNYNDAKCKILNSDENHKGL